MNIERITLSLVLHWLIECLGGSRATWNGAHVLAKELRHESLTADHVNNSCWIRCSRTSTIRAEFTVSCRGKLYDSEVQWKSAEIAALPICGNTNHIFLHKFGLFESLFYIQRRSCVSLVRRHGLPTTKKRSRILMASKTN